MKPTQLNETGNGLYVQRVLDLPGLLEKKSHFLFGPRQTGKTSLVRHTLKGARVYDLLDTSVYLALSRNPGRIAQEVRERNEIKIHSQQQQLNTHEQQNHVFAINENARHAYREQGAGQHQIVT